MAGPTAVVVAQTELMIGRMNMAQLQSEIGAESVKDQNLQLGVSQLENPASIVGQAEHQGLVPPSQVQDLPEVTVPVTVTQGQSDKSTKSVSKQTPSTVVHGYR
jgi:hypothetical protein